MILKANLNIYTKYIISLIIFFILILTYFIDNLFFSQCSTIIIWTISFIYALRYNLANPLLLLLISIFFFNLCVIFFSVFKSDFYINNTLLYNPNIDILFSNEILIKTCLITSSFILGLVLGFTNKQINTKFTNINSQKINKNDKYVFFFISILALIYSILLLIDKQIFGYKSTIHLRSNYELIKFLGNLNNLFFYYFFCKIMYKETRIKTFLYCGIILLIPNLILSFVGQRGPFLTTFIFLIIIYQYYFPFRKLNLTFISFFSCLLLIFFWYLESARFGSVFFDFKNLKDIISGFEKFTLLISGSFAILPTTIYFEKFFFNKIPFILGYPFGIFSFAANYTYEGLVHKSYLSQHLTFLLNPSQLYSGSTVGSSSLAELYELFKNNYLFYILSGALIIKGYEFILFYSRKSSLNLFLLFIVTQSYIMLPRSSVFNFLNKNTLSIIFLIILIKIPYIIKNYYDR